MAAKACHTPPMHLDPPSRSSNEKLPADCVTGKHVTGP